MFVTKKKDAEVGPFLKPQFSKFQFSISFVPAYGYKTSGAEKTNDDNLYLGIVLVVAIVVTGLFSYFQRRKTTKIMQKFQNLIPQYTSCVRNGEKVNLLATLVSSSVTRFGEISTLWQTFTSLWVFFDGLFLIWQNAEPTLTNL